MTFLAQAKDSLWSIDFFQCESINLYTFCVMVVIDVFSRRIIGFGIESYPMDGAAVCRMFNHAVSGKQRPQYLSTEHDPLFRFHRWLANLRIHEIEEIKTVPFVPSSHPFVERLIGTLRREYLDRLFFWNATDLEHKLQAYTFYYNNSRVHQSLNGTTPEGKAGQAPSSTANLTCYS